MHHKLNNIDEPKWSIDVYIGVLFNGPIGV